MPMLPFRYAADASAPETHAPPSTDLQYEVVERCASPARLFSPPQPGTATEASPSALPTPLDSSPPSLDDAAGHYQPPSPSSDEQQSPEGPAERPGHAGPAQQPLRSSGEMPPDRPGPFHAVDVVSAEGGQLAQQIEAEASERRATRRGFEAVARPVASGPSLTSTCTWIRDVEFVERAKRGLLWPLELIRLLPPDMAYDLGIDINLWGRPAPLISPDHEYARRRGIFAHAFARRETFDLAWDQYLSIAVECRPESGPQIIRAFSSRLHDIRLLRARISWPTMVRFLHDQLESAAFHGIDLSSHSWVNTAVTVMSYLDSLDLE